MFADVLPEWLKQSLTQQPDEPDAHFIQKRGVAPQMLLPFLNHENTVTYASCARTIDCSSSGQVSPSGKSSNRTAPRGQHTIPTSSRSRSPTEDRSAYSKGTSINGQDCERHEEDCLVRKPQPTVRWDWCGPSWCCESSRHWLFSAKQKVPPRWFYPARNGYWNSRRQQSLRPTPLRDPRHNPLELVKAVLVRP